MAQKIVVVGASVAGYNVVKELRKKGYDGEITLISNQEVLPYDLKPLSKDWMLDQTDLTPPIFTRADYYSDKNIQVQLQTTIEQINPADKTIRTQQGALIAYDKLVIAIGSTLRRLTVPGVEAEGIFYLRDYSHAKKMKEWRKNAKELVIVGAGFIGLEMASTFAQLGLKVTVIEHADYPLGRILGKEASSYFRKMHESHGVTFLTGEDVQAFEQDENGRVKAALTASGKEIPCQMAIIGIGVVPNTSLTHPDLKVERGIVVNEFGETSLPDVYAAGDCTVWPYHGQQIHVEHWEHAWAHGKAIAHNLIAEKSEAFQVRPYFWTDEYDQTFEYLGHTLTWDRILVRGSLDERAFTLAYVDEKNYPIAIFFANNSEKRQEVAHFMDQNRPIDEVKFTDLKVPFKQL